MLQKSVSTPFQANFLVWRAHSWGDPRTSQKVAFLEEKIYTNSYLFGTSSKPGFNPFLGGGDPRISQKVALSEEKIYINSCLFGTSSKPTF